LTGDEAGRAATIPEFRFLDANGEAAIDTWLKCISTIGVTIAAPTRAACWRRFSRPRLAALQFEGDDAWPVLMGGDAMQQVKAEG
jgi:hypothetical protein